MVKKSFLLLSALVMTMTAMAQSVNVNFGGVQASYNSADLQNIALSGNNLVVNGIDGKALVTVSQNEVTSLEFSEKGANQAVKYMDGKPAQFVFSCIEVNNVNPLVHLNYRLKRTGKYLFDGVILFSSNINYSTKEDVVYLHNNENVQPILLHADHYIRPLKERGIKVFLSILGNHDGSGLANLGPERARDFAKAIADTLDKYDLDGVFFDDEYSDYSNHNLNVNKTGFTSPSYASASRLVYEIKKAIGPDRWTLIYRYGIMSSLDPVDGVQPGSYIDYALSDYNVQTDMSRSYPGITRAQQGVNSINMNSPWSLQSRMGYVRNQGYGALMLYNLTPYDAYAYSYYQKGAMDDVAKYLFDDEIVYGTGKYPKDWTPMSWLSTPVR